MPIDLYRDADRGEGTDTASISAGYDNGVVRRLWRNRSKVVPADPAACCRHLDPQSDVCSETRMHKARHREHG